MCESWPRDAVVFFFEDDKMWFAEVLYIQRERELLATL